jgi:hypothetical protein
MMSIYGRSETCKSTSQELFVVKACVSFTLGVDLQAFARRPHAGRGGGQFVVRVAAKKNSNLKCTRFEKINQ